jgi:hypothetical protein
VAGIAVGVPAATVAVVAVVGIAAEDGKVERRE